MSSANPPGSTATGTTTGTTTIDLSGPRPLPRLLLKDAANRVAWLALAVAVVVVAVQLFQRAAQPTLATALDSPLNRLAALGAVLIGLAVFGLHRYRVVSASTMLTLGMVLQIAVGFAISFIETTIPLRPGAPVVGISALGPWIVLVGVFIPNRPLVTLSGALATASIWPATYAINAARFHFATPQLGQWLVWPSFNYLMAVLAYLISRHIYGVSVEAQAAMDLGSYRLVGLIGEGGMGEVWKANHRLLARAAAVKVVRTNAGSGTSREAELALRRFEREANVIAGLQSPHTVYLFDFGVAQDGRFYYVMELLDGVSLQTLVKNFGPQPAGRVVNILRECCRSLEEAHERDVVHRDLKPSNIMLCKVGLAFDFVKILDFGLAKSMHATDASLLTMEGVTAGTPGYIAPEVALGEGKVDGRADLYALGCVAYFLLTGTLVFEDANPTAMALKHVQAVPDPPSSRTELPIPADLEAIVMQCLAKQPDERPAGATELSRALKRCNVPPWTDEDAQAWWENHLPPTSTLRSFAQQPGSGVQQATVIPPVIRKG